MSNYDDRPVDIENPPADLEGASLITKPDRTPQTEEEVRLDGIPSVRKPGYGNWIWAEKRCARRSGLTVGEAMAIQAAYRVYQKGGDIREFYDYVVEFTQGYNVQPTGMRSHRWFRTLLDKARGWLAVMDVMIQFNPRASIAWADLELLLKIILFSRNHREILQERMHTMETLQKLSKLFDLDEDGQSAPQEISRQDQETQNHASRALKT
jgi:hypothetical protein